MTKRTNDTGGPVEHKKPGIPGHVGYLLAVLVCLAGAPLPAQAQSLPQPTGPVLLTVTGAIGVTNAGAKAVFDRTMLEAMGLARLRTTSPWTQGVAEFEGVPVARLLDTVKARGRILHAIATDGFEIDLPTDEMRKYPVLLALQQDGKELRPGERGPIWIVYPRDEFRELADKEHDSRWIWQLETIKVR